VTWQSSRAKSAGGVIVEELESKNYGGEDYRCRDIEGHLR
jgi:uncharacterized glyoxalase superfamily protein PhnB